MDKCIGLTEKYTRITELTPDILHIFVSKIVIHEQLERFKQNAEGKLIFISVISAIQPDYNGKAMHMHYLFVDSRINKGVFMGTLLNQRLLYFKGKHSHFTETTYDFYQLH